jgi:hypothetical protein
VPEIARGECRLSYRGDAGDLHIADLQRSTCALPGGCDRAGGDGSWFVKGLDPSFELLSQQVVERPLELLPSATGREQL